MARRRRRNILVPEARDALDRLKGEVMKKQGYSGNPEHVKFEVAEDQNIPLKQDYNGHLTSVQAGKIGGPIGGNMVKEMIRMAQSSLSKNTE